MKHLIMISALIIGSSILPTFADEDPATNFTIIPQSSNQATVTQQVESLGSTDAAGNFWNKYRAAADNNADVGDQLASGILNRDTLLNYTVYLVRFMAQFALFVGALMVIYSGYTYAMSSFAGTKPTTDPIRNALKGILIITFSYALIRILTSAFL